MRFAVCSLLLIASVGCGSSSGTVPLKGKVTLDGAPLVNASISFIPQGTGRQATGTTDSNGEFAMSTIDPKDGCMPGTYKVAIVPATPMEESTEGMSADEAMAAAAAAAAKRKGKPSGPQVPEAYTRVDKTPLTQEVPAKGPVVYEIKSN